MSALAASIGNIVTFGLDDRYYDTFADKVRAQTVESVTAIAGEVVHPEPAGLGGRGRPLEDRGRFARAEAG